MKLLRILLCLNAILFSINIGAQSTFQIMLQKAQEGDPKAQNNIAAYYKEVGDCESAYYWYCQAIRQGDVIAEYGIGQCHAIGCGTEQNYRLAAFHFQRAAEKGLKEAQLVLAEMYERGLGVPQDDQKAMYWRNKAK